MRTRRLPSQKFERPTTQERSWETNIISKNIVTKPIYKLTNKKVGENNVHISLVNGEKKSQCVNENHKRRKERNHSEWRREETSTTLEKIRERQRVKIFEFDKLY